MNAPLPLDISRRGLLAGGGALVFCFSFVDFAGAHAPVPAGASVPDNNMLDS
ncbi:MAG: hypothetical protein QOD94_1666, partial [Alphaproteobacteria bacterium]|nr:hypothetical protein [Alphaproteobacteria bacterium]